jgi:hypothetical protein
MATINLVFVSGKAVTHRLIQLGTLSRWNHVAVQVSSTHVIESVFEDGVRLRRLDSLLQAYPDHQVVAVDVPNPREAIDFLYSQLGQPYDWKAIAAIAVGLGLPMVQKVIDAAKGLFGVKLRDLQDPSMWFCSELAETAIFRGGRIRITNTSRLSPGQQFDLPASGEWTPKG